MSPQLGVTLWRQAHSWAAPTCPSPPCVSSSAQGIDAMHSHHMTSATGGCPGPGRTGPVSFMRGASPSLWTASLWTATTLWDALTENGMAAAGWQANLQRHPSRCSGCVLSSSTGGVSGQSGTTSLSEGFSRQRQVPGCGGTRQMGKTFPKTDRHAPGQLPPVCMRVPYC